MSDFRYAGQESELFAEAAHWKSYWGSKIRAYLTGAVLEMGAGLGSNTLRLRNAAQQRWVCLEPDKALAARLRSALDQAGLANQCEVSVGVLDGLREEERFDAILYLDVLEHIQDDRAELRCASQHLKPRGKLIVLTPAHNRLFSTFDQAVGHLRRYTKATLRDAIPLGMVLLQLVYLDSVGIAASLANRLILRQGLPTRRQVAFWDRGMVPLSRLIDPLLGHALGKSLLGVWERRA